MKKLYFILVFCFGFSFFGYSQNEVFKKTNIPGLVSKTKSAVVPQKVNTPQKDASSGIIVLDFEGLGNNDLINEFYNGGVSSLGNSGTDYGISFTGANGIIDGDAGGTGNIANEPSPSTVLNFYEQVPILNVPNGFNIGFSFYYCSAYEGTVDVYDGLNGTGNLLGSATINRNYGLGVGDPGGYYNFWDIVSISISGVGKSIVFNGVADYCVFDDITFGSLSPGQQECADIEVDSDKDLCGAKVEYSAPSPDGAIVTQIDESGYTSGDTFPIGVTIQQYEIDYLEGEDDTCSFTVTVNDIAPDLVVNSIEITLYQNGEYVLTKDDIAEISAGTTDNCTSFEDLDIMVSPKAFECVHVGEPIPVKVTVVDGSGNAVSDWTMVTVYDETPPVALCKDVNLVLDEAGKARINPSKVNAGDGTVVLPNWARTYNDMAGGSYDACGISSLNIDLYNFDCSDIGENTVTLTVVDAHGNTSTCESTVTVSDNMVPVIDPVEDVELVIEASSCETEVEYPTILVTDNCETTLELVDGLGEDGVFPVGTTTETWKATDDAGNTAMVSFDVTIVAVNDEPAIDKVTDVTVDEDTYSVEVTLTGISEGDDCEEQEVMVTATGDNAELITSVTVDYTTGDSTGTVTMEVAPQMSGEAEIIVTVEDELGATTTDTFMVTVTAVNDAPFLVTTIVDQIVNASYELKVPISSVLGELFDDIDDDVLTVEVTAEGTDSLPAWAVMMGDTLVCTPAIADTGCVNIVVTATDAGGLSVSDTFEVCVDGFPVSIGELGMNQFEVQMYPNPTRGQVNMDISSGVYEVQLSVMDITGKVVLQKQYSASENITFDMSGKVSGMYFVKMNVDGNQIVKKLVVDRK